MTPILCIPSTWLTKCVNMVLCSVIFVFVCFLIHAVHDGVRTSILRPPSKPRVRNPITMKRLQEEKKLKISLLQQEQQQQVAHTHTITV